MADRRFPRWARWTTLGCGVAVIGASTYLVVDALPSQAATAGLRTSTVATGSVTQTISLSGSVQRVDQVTAAFRTSGTVTSVKVSVGDEVEAGDVLATINTADLKRAVTVAQANLVSAQAALDAAGSSPTTPAASSAAAGPSPTAAAGPDPTPSTPTSGSPGSSGSGGSGSTPPPGPRVDTSPVHKAVGAYDALVQAAVTTCQPVIDAGATPEPSPTPSPTPTPSPSPSESSTPVPSPSASPSPSPIPSPSASPSSEPSANDDTPTPDASPSASLAASGATVIPASLRTAEGDADGPTPEQVSACVKALSTALNSAQHAASAMDELAKALGAATKALQEQQSKAASTGSGSQPTGTNGTTATGGTGSTGATGTGSAGGSGGSGAAGGGAGQGQSTASLEVAVLQATQELAAADQDLDGAVLKAPISGTVGQVDLVKGEPADTSSGVVIVGPGAVVVTVDLPLAQLGKVRVSQDVVVTPAGTTDEVPGLVQSIGVLPSSTTSSTPTYPVRVAVSDAPVTLASGSTATATITLATVDNVLTVPVSAVSGVSSGRGSVQVLSDGTMKTTPVTVGAVGGGKVHVVQGLTAGQVVVVADPATALPSSDSTNRFRRSTSGVGGLTGQGGPGGGFGGPPPG